MRVGDCYRRRHYKKIVCERIGTVELDINSARLQTLRIMSPTNNTERRVLYFAFSEPTKREATIPRGTNCLFKQSIEQLSVHRISAIFQIDSRVV